MYDFASLTRTQLERTETMRRVAARSRQLSQLRPTRTARAIAQLRSHAARALRAFAARLDADLPASPGAA